MITKDTYSKLYEFHKVAYEKYLIPTVLLNLVSVICFVVILFISPYTAPIVVVFFVTVLLNFKRDAHREGFIDGFTEASNMYSSTKTRDIYGEDNDDLQVSELLEEPKYISEIERNIKLLKTTDKK